MTDVNRSTLAAQPTMRNPKDAPRRKPWGLLLHTTGGGVTARAKDRGQTPLAVALKVYRSSQDGSNGYKWGGPAYVLDHDGKLHQIAPDDALTAHAGGSDRADYVDGDWTKRATPAAVAHWRRQWPTKRHPYQLFPSKSPNVDYIGVEMIPIGDGFGGEPMASGLRFTMAQHLACAALGLDVAKRHGWPLGWHRTGRLVGHEDVQPINRDDNNGGWDPGWLRAKPYFDFEFVRRALDIEVMP